MVPQVKQPQLTANGFSSSALINKKENTPTAICKIQFEIDEKIHTTFKMVTNIETVEDLKCLLSHRSQIYEGYELRLKDVEYDLSFNGKIYSNDTTLGEIHTEIDLTTVVVKIEKTPATLEKEKLEKQKEKLEKQLDFAHKKLKELTLWSWQKDPVKKLFLCNPPSTFISDKEKFILLKKNYEYELLNKIPDLQEKLKTKQVKIDDKIYFELELTIPYESETINRLLEDEIKNLAEVTLQGRATQAEEFSLSGMPTDVINHISSFLPFSLLDNKLRISTELERQIFLRNKVKATFNEIEPFYAPGVSQSLGGNVYLMLPYKKTPVTREEVNTLKNISYVECNKNGIRFHFHDHEDAQWFEIILKNKNYAYVSYKKAELRKEFGIYQASVTISNLREVQQFIEISCGYHSDYPKDLFANKNLQLSKDFFIQELKSITEEKLNEIQKRKLAKKIINDFLPYLIPGEANELLTQLKSDPQLKFLQNKLENCFLKIEELINKEVQFEEGLIKERGTVVEQKNAFTIYLKLKDQGYLPAIFRLAHLYQNGIGCVENMKESIYCLQLASNKGYKPASYWLGQFYKDQAITFEKANENEKAKIADDNATFYFKKAEAALEDFEEVS